MTFTSIVQSVALYVLAAKLLEIWSEHRSTAIGVMVPLDKLPYFLFYLITIVSVIYLYTWFGAILQYIPQIRGMFALFFIGLAEIMALLSLTFESPKLWWLWTAVVSGGGVAAFGHSLSHCRPDLFRDGRISRDKICTAVKKQHLVNMGLCLSGAVVSIWAVINLPPRFDCQSAFEKVGWPLVMTLFALLLLGSSKAFLVWLFRQYRRRFTQLKESKR
jgi:hypothetical protein